MDNGQFPGTTLNVTTGDTLVVTVLNYAQYDVTIHWFAFLLRVSNLNDLRTIDEWINFTNM